MNTLKKLNVAIVQCRRCPRLVRWRQECAKDPPRRFVGQDYWANPLPAFGDRNAQLLIIGLAPAAHGGNRTGRMFTGDRSGDWLYAALHRACLLYTSDAADERSSVDLGGRRII